MAGAAGCSLPEAASGRAGRVITLVAAGSLVLRRMKRRALVRAKKHGIKGGTGAPFRRGFLLPHTALWVPRP